MPAEIEVLLPETTEDILESLIVFWHSSTGDPIEKGQVLVEVQTEKAVFEIEAPASGRLGRIIKKRGDVANVGEVLAVIDQTDAADETSQTEQICETQAAPEGQTEPLSVQVPPRLRRMARELGVDLSQVVGTGPKGRITENDIQSAVKQPSSGESFMETTAVRKTIARRMMQSLQQSAQLTLTAWADVTALSEQRKVLAPEATWNIWAMRAAVLAILQHPYINSVWEENGIRQFEHVHLGVAVNTEEALIVPCIRHAEQMTLLQFNEAVSQSVQKAQSGRLASAELSGSTFTVTNLGTFGIEFFTPILNPPEAAILGVGQIEKKLALNNGKLAEQARLPLSLTFDHRVIDGAPAAKYLQSLSKLLGDPWSLM